MDVEPLYFFDSHIHRTTDEEEFLDLAERFEGVAVLGPWTTIEMPSDTLLPFAFPARDEDGALELSERTIPVLEAQLESGAQGIGELSVRHPPTINNPSGDDVEADHPILLEVYELAAERGVPVNLHFDHSVEHVDELHAALDHTDAVFIWAHAGDAQPDAVREVMEAHPSLYVDLACRGPHYERGYDFNAQSIGELDVGLDTDWKSLLEDHGDRFLFGSDIGPEGRNEQLDEVIDYFTAMFGELDEDTAHAIAHDNAERLFGVP